MRGAEPPIVPVGRRRSGTNHATRTLIDNWPEQPIWGRDDGPYKHVAPQRIPARFVICAMNPARWLIGFAEYDARFLQMPADQVLEQLYHRERVETEIESYVSKYDNWLDEMDEHGGTVLRHEDACQQPEATWRRAADELGLEWPPTKHGEFRTIEKRVGPSNYGRKQPVDYEPPDYETHAYIERLTEEQLEAIHRALERAGATGHGGLLDRLGYGPTLQDFLAEPVRVGP